MTRGWESIIPGCGRTSALSGGGTLDACWLHEPQPTTKQTVGLGIPHLAVRHRLGGSAFLFPGCWVCRDIEGFLIGRRGIILPGCGVTGLDTHSHAGVLPSRARVSNRGGGGIQREIDNASPTRACDQLASTLTITQMWSPYLNQERRARIPAVYMIYC